MSINKKISDEQLDGILKNASSDINKAHQSLCEDTFEQTKSSIIQNALNHFQRDTGFQPKDAEKFSLSAKSLVSGIAVVIVITVGTSFLSQQQSKQNYHQLAFLNNGIEVEAEVEDEAEEIISMTEFGQLLSETTSTYAEFNVEDRYTSFSIPEMELSITLSDIEYMEDEYNEN